MSDLFPVGTECFMMAISHYGSAGKVCSSWYEISLVFLYILTEVSGIFGNGCCWHYVIMHRYFGDIPACDLRFKLNFTLVQEYFT